MKKKDVFIKSFISIYNWDKIPWIYFKSKDIIFILPRQVYFTKIWFGEVCGVLWAILGEIAVILLRRHGSSMIHGGWALVLFSLKWGVGVYPGGFPQANTVF